jgi:type II secretory pathway pseudopilin PulG
MKNSANRIQRLATKQAGLTLLEVILSLTIISSGTVGLNMIADRFSDDTKNTVTASQMRVFGEAAKAYIKDNYAAVQAVATATTPALIDVPTLIAAGNLPSGFLATNAFRQSMCALVLEPSANRLQAMVVSEGGINIDDLSMGNIASVIGGSGGAVYASDAAVIRGAIGGWSIPTSTFDNLVNNVNKKCDGAAGNVRLVAGHPAMALWFENGDTSSAFLARDAVPGRPELNAMNTPIHMKSVQVTGGACTTVGAIAQDGAGGILACQAGAWKLLNAQTASESCEPVYGRDLNWVRQSGRCYVGETNRNTPVYPMNTFFLEVFAWGSAIDTVFHVTQVLYGQMWDTRGKVWIRQGSGNKTEEGNWQAWVQLADPGVSVQDGSVLAQKDLVAGKDVFVNKKITLANDVGNSNIYANTDMMPYGALTVQGERRGYSGLAFLDVQGNQAMNLMTNRTSVGFFNPERNRWLNYSDDSGNLTLNQTDDRNSGRLNPGWAVETEGCITGQIAKAAYTVADGWAYNGKTLSCVNAVWTAPGTGGYKNHVRVLIEGGTSVRYPYCAYAGKNNTDNTYYNFLHVKSSYGDGTHEWYVGGSGWLIANCSY